MAAERGRLLDRAREAFVRARRLEADGGRAQLEDAGRAYERGIELLLSFKRALPKGDPRHGEIQRLASDELGRAERLKLRTRGGAARGGERAGAANDTGGGAASDELRRRVDPKLWEMIEREVSDGGAQNTTFDDVAGLEAAKQALREMVILPAQRPDLFDDPLRKPPRGLLLYGPPGNGKTLVANAVAGEAGCTFLPVSASSLVSKGMGDGEKLVRALFLVARARQPSIVFIDEIDSILSRRREDEHEASRRLKTEFMVQFNALAEAANKDRVVVIGATNLPDQLDDAVLRRLSRHVYVGPPDAATRRALLRKLLGSRTALTAANFRELVRLTAGYSSSDVRMLCADAAMGPLRDAGFEALASSPDTGVGPITWAHFADALENVPPTVSPERLAVYEAYRDAHAGPRAARAGQAAVSSAAAVRPAAAGAGARRQQGSRKRGRKAVPESGGCFSQ